MLIRTKLSINLLLQLALVAVVVGALLQLAMGYKAQEQAQWRRFESQRLADELQHSIKASSMLARQYVAGRDPEHARLFRQLASIREGRAPRPADYDELFWDLALADPAKAGSAGGQAQSLPDRMRAAGFEPAELALLDEAWRRGLELQGLEAGAVQMVEGAGIARQPPPDILAQASQMLHGRAYLAAKAAALEPLRRFVAEAQQRLDAERDQAVTRLRRAGWVAGAALAVLALQALIAAFDLDRSVRRPVAMLRDWAQSVRSGRLDRRTRLEGKSEFGELSAVIDQMADSVERNLAELREEVLRRTRAEEVVRHLANHDALTGLPSLRLLHDRLERAMARAQRAGQGVAVLFVDLNGFKPINDRFGHESGDAVLKAVSQRLTGGVRDADTVGRIGGDEFLVVLSDVAEMAAAAQVRDKLDAALREPIYLSAPKTLVSLSAAIGIALFPSMASDLTSLLRLADEDMYRVKAAQKAGGSAPQR